MSPFFRMEFWLAFFSWKEQIQSAMFPNMLVFMSNSVGIVQNLLNEVLVESFILADFANYHDS